jgi:hypothetical protein
MKMIFRTIQAIVIFTMCQLAFSAPIITYSSGYISGVDDVVVDGQMFDVVFKQGSCNTALIGGCVPSNFTFLQQTEAEAAVASFALQSVFQGIANMPAAMGASGTGVGIYTPAWEENQIDVFGVLLAYTTNAADSNENNDVLDELAAPSQTAIQWGDSDELYYANWTEVPVPNTLWLVCIALVGLFWSRRKAGLI